MRPEISVIIPTYQRAELLSKTLGSLVVQERADVEVIVVDHESTDNTSEICASFQGALRLQYERIERTANSPGEPRNRGAELANSNTLLFLDCGLLAAPTLAAAHAQFHRDLPSRVGLGLYHLHKTEAGWNSSIHNLSIRELGRVLSADPSLRDSRYGDDVARMTLPWVWGWTGNMSVPAGEFAAVGGFDAEQAYGFEDLDISYRLHERGLGFDIVSDGWGVELPHPRAPEAELERMETQGCEKSFSKHKSLGLECFRFVQLARYSSDRSSEARKTYSYLEQLASDVPRTDPRALERLKLPPGRRLLVWGKPGLGFDAVTLGEANVVSTDTAWGCTGVLLPAPDRHFGVAVVGGLWQYLKFAPAGGRYLCDVFADELSRTCGSVVFLEGPPHQKPNLSRSEMEDLCEQRGLPYEFAEAPG